MLSDAQRQQTVELFLGLLLKKYVPSSKPLYRTPALLQANLGCRKNPRTEAQRLGSCLLR